MTDTTPESRLRELSELARTNSDTINVLRLRVSEWADLYEKNEEKHKATIDELRGELSRAKRERDAFKRDRDWWSARCRGETSAIADSAVQVGDPVHVVRVGEIDALKARITELQTECNRYQQEARDARREADVAQTTTRVASEALRDVVDTLGLVRDVVGYVESDGSAHAMAVRVVEHIMSSDNEADRYQRLAARTLGTLRADNEGLAIIALGLTGEAGEVAEVIKKHVGHGHALDHDKVRKELGDVCWYIAAMCTVLDFDLSVVMRENIEKLRKRYPDGFSSEASKARVDVGVLEHNGPHSCTGDGQ